MPVTNRPVVIVDGSRHVPAIVTLESENGDSLAVTFDAIVDGCVGGLALLRGQDRVYRNIFTGHPIIVRDRDE